MAHLESRVQAWPILQWSGKSCNSTWHPGLSCVIGVRGYWSLLQDSQPSKSRVYNFLDKKVGTLGSRLYSCEGAGTGEGEFMSLVTWYHSQTPPKQSIQYPLVQYPISMAAHAISHSFNRHSRTSSSVPEPRAVGVNCTLMSRSVGLQTHKYLGLWASGKASQRR